MCQKTRCLSVKSRFINYITRYIGRKIGNPDRSMIIDVIFLVKSNYYPNNFCNFSSRKVLKKQTCIDFTLFWPKIAKYAKYLVFFLTLDLPIWQYFSKSILRVNIFDIFEKSISISLPSVKIVDGHKSPHFNFGAVFFKELRLLTMTIL